MCTLLHHCDVNGIYPWSQTSTSDCIPFFFYIRILSEVDFEINQTHLLFKNTALSISTDLSGNESSSVKSLDDLQTIEFLKPKTDELVYVYFLHYFTELLKHSRELTLAEYRFALKHINDDEIYPKISEDITLTIAFDRLNVSTSIKRPGLMPYELQSGRSSGRSFNGFCDDSGEGRFCKIFCRPFFIPLSFLRWLEIMVLKNCIAFEVEFLRYRIPARIASNKHTPVNRRYISLKTVSNTRLRTEYFKLPFLFWTWMPYLISDKRDKMSKLLGLGSCRGMYPATTRKILIEWCNAEEERVPSDSSINAPRWLWWSVAAEWCRVPPTHILVNSVDWRFMLSWLYAWHLALTLPCSDDVSVMISVWPG